MTVLETPARRLRRGVLALLPAGQRARLRRLYETLRAPSAGASATFTAEGEMFAVAIDGGPTIRFLVGCRPDVERHFTDREAAAELDRFMRRARASGVLFDVGANNGLFSLIYCLMHPANRAIAFEPSPRLADLIQRLARLNGVDSRLQVVAKAVAETSEKRDLLLDTRGGYVQSDQFDGTAHDGWQQTRIETTTLDAELDASARPTIVKIDVEGYEREVLLGASRVLAAVRPVIFLEVHLNYLQHRGILAVDVIRPLTACGYGLSDLSGRRRTEGNIGRSWASVLHLIATPAGAPSARGDDTP